VTDAETEPVHEVIGGAFLIDAPNMDEAVKVASLHPTVQLAAGEQLGWRIEIRPVHYFHAPHGVEREA
jgi:hypothetical protein